MPFPTFKKQEEIPDAFRDHYEEKDGEWVPKEDPATELRGALQKERDSVKRAEEAQRKAERELADLRSTAEAKKTGVTDEQLKKLREDIRADLEKEYAPSKEQAEKLAAENRTLRLDNAVREIAAKKGGVRSERLDAWWKLFSERFDLTDDGKPMVKDQPGIAVEKFIAETLKKEMPDFYAGTKADGGGAGGMQKVEGGASKMSYEDFKKLRPTEQMRAAREAEKATA